MSKLSGFDAARGRGSRPLAVGQRGRRPGFSATTEAFSEARASTARSGFTLIELLVAMTVLAVMLLGVTRVFTHATNATRAGYERSYSDGNARMVMDTLMEDLCQTVTGSRAYFQADKATDMTYTSELAVDDLRFVAALGPELCESSAVPGALGSTLVAVRYWVEPEADDDGFNYWVLKRGTRCGTDLSSGSFDTYPLIEHVVEFRVIPQNTIGLPYPEYDSGSLYTNVLPGSVSIMLSVVSEEDHRRAMRISDSGKRLAFLDQQARRYFSHSYFPARRGRIGTRNY